MSICDKILRFVCQAFSVVFGHLTALAIVGCMFGVILASSRYKPYEVTEQVRALGLVAIVCFIAGASFVVVGDSIGK